MVFSLRKKERQENRGNFVAVVLRSMQFVKKFSVEIGVRAISATHKNSINRRKRRRRTNERMKEKKREKERESKKRYPLANTEMSGYILYIHINAHIL